ncbi:MAG: hypothetical protein AAB425_14420, partial [Bdellovibrionota bacterium]
MKLITYARNSEELQAGRHAGANEVILSHLELSRLGVLDDQAIEKLASEATRFDLRPILEWDILMRPEDFERAVSVLRRVNLALFAAIRVQDPGALHFALRELPNLSIQLVLETGNH